MATLIMYLIVKYHATFTTPLTLISIRLSSTNILVRYWFFLWNIQEEVISDKNNVFVGFVCNLLLLIRIYVHITRVIDNNFPIADYFVSRPYVYQLAFVHYYRSVLGSGTVERNVNSPINSGLTNYIESIFVSHSLCSIIAWFIYVMWLGPFPSILNFQ